MLSLTNLALFPSYVTLSDEQEIPFISPARNFFFFVTSFQSFASFSSSSMGVAGSGGLEPVDRRVDFSPRLYRARASYHDHNKDRA